MVYQSSVSICLTTNISGVYTERFICEIIMLLNSIPYKRMCLTSKENLTKRFSEKYKHMCLTTRLYGIYMHTCIHTYYIHAYLHTHLKQKF